MLELQVGSRLLEAGSPELLVSLGPLRTSQAVVFLQKPRKVIFQHF